MRRPVALIRLLRLIGHVLIGAGMVLLLFPRLSADERGHRVNAWARKLLAILNVQVTVHGRPPAVSGEGALIASNHVSWLDIHVLHSILPTRFVSKAEVRGWPVVGWLADAAGTLFLERTKKTDAHRMNQAMAELLCAGECLTLFPEGTTSDGSGLKPFYPSLLQPALDAQAKLWPVAIRYRHADGRLNLEAAYYDHISLGASLNKILHQPSIHVTVHFLSPILASDLSRKELAGRAEALIREVLVHGGRDMTPGSAADPPAAEQ